MLDVSVFWTTEQLLEGLLAYVFIDADGVARVQRVMHEEGVAAHGSGLRGRVHGLRVQHARRRTQHRQKQNA